MLLKGSSPQWKIVATFGVSWASCGDLQQGNDQCQLFLASLLQLQQSSSQCQYYVTWQSVLFWTQRTLIFDNLNCNKLLTGFVIEWTLFPLLDWFLLLTDFCSPSICHHVRAFCGDGVIPSSLASCNWWTRDWPLCQVDDGLHCRCASSSVPRGKVGWGATGMPDSSAWCGFAAEPLALKQQSRCMAATAWGGLVFAWLSRFGCDVEEDYDWLQSHDHVVGSSAVPLRCGAVDAGCKECWWLSTSRGHFVSSSGCPGWLGGWAEMAGWATPARCRGSLIFWGCPACLTVFWTWTVFDCWSSLSNNECAAINAVSDCGCWSHLRDSGSESLCLTVAVDVLTGRNLSLSWGFGVCLCELLKLTIFHWRMLLLVELKQICVQVLLTL